MSDRAVLMHIEVRCVHAYSRGVDRHWTAIVHNSSRSRKYLDNLLDALGYPMAMVPVRFTRRTEASRW